MSAAATKRPIDSEGLLAATAELPERLVSATKAALAARLGSLTRAEPLREVIILASGPDAIAGEALLAVSPAALRLPVVAVERSPLPGFVSSGTLCVVVATRREDPQLEASMNEATRLGATVIAISPQGGLAERAAVLGLSHFEIPSTVRDARDGLGYLLAPLFVIAEHAGVLADAGALLEQAVVQAKQRGDALVGGDGVALGLAHTIGRSFPLLHGCAGIGALAARRFASAVHLSASFPAFFAAHPGLERDEVSGFGQAGDVTRQLLTLIELRSDFDPRGALVSTDRVVALLRETVASVCELHAEGQGPLAQLVDLVLVGDFVALHLAAAEGIDPGPVPAIDELSSVVAP